VVNVELDFIVETVKESDMNCHFDDGWGPSDEDPTDQYGYQDCLLDRYNLCAMDQSKGGWLHFVACTYRNQDETSNIHDNRTSFMNTINYCSSITNIQESALTKCATGHQGYTLLSASNAREVKGNTNKDAKGHGHPNWIFVNGKASKDSSAWLADICAGIPDKSPEVAAACKPSAK
jgi:hypothetical protein